MGSKNSHKKNKRKQTAGAVAANNGGDDDTAKGLITDERFAAAHTDPRFSKVPRHKAKVAIDSRFDRIFTDKRFASSSAPLDKRGRPRKVKSGESLKHYYRMDDDGDDGKLKKKKKDKSESESESELEEEKSELGSESEEFEEEKMKSKKLEKVVGEESSEEEEEESGESQSETGDDIEASIDTEDEIDTKMDTEEEAEVEEEVEEEFQLQEENVPAIDKETHRLAVVNLDWRHVWASDLFMVLSSFLPKGGQILSVAVYPSEFGLQRMKEEEVHGPIGVFDHKKKKSGEEEEDDNDEDGEINKAKLRAYETSRLRYYYAVVECDSIATADYLYKTCDRVEFERSSNVLDLRFIPDSMEFKHEPRDVCTEAPTTYEGLDFHTRALQHSNIELTWDDDEPHRVKTLKRKFNDDQLADLELKEFLASDESESDDDENDEATEDKPDKKKDKLDKYRALLQSGEGSDEDNDKGQEMEVTFNTGLEDLSKKILEKKDRKQETVWEAHLRKQREKKKARKNKSKYSSDDESSETDGEPIEEPDDFFIEEPTAKRSKKEVKGKSSKAEKKKQNTDKEAEASTAELELLLADDNGADTNLKGFNLKREKGKGKRGKEVLEEDKIPVVDYNDPRFSALFTSPNFALDPTDPQFKRSAAYARQVVQKKKKSNQDQLGGSQHMKLSDMQQLPADVPEDNKDDNTDSDVLPSKREKYELSSLVRSIKNKSKQVKLSSSSKTLMNDDKQQSCGKAAKEVKPELATLVQSLKKKTKVQKR